MIGHFDVTVMVGGHTIETEVVCDVVLSDTVKVTANGVKMMVDNDATKINMVRSLADTLRQMADDLEHANNTLA